MRNNKTQVFRYISFGIAASIMLLIFLMSSQDAQTSSGTSGGFIRAIAPFLKKNFDLLPIAQQEAFVSSLQFFTRKGAHFFIYMLLGIFVSCGIFTYEIKTIIKVAISFSICAVYSVSDEIHQTFVPGRSCEVRDMLLDCSGAAVGCALVLCIYVIIKRKACRE